jgi:hypothetical protein
MLCGMQHGVALVGPQPEQPLRLDQLEALVGERGRVDGDLRPHRPVGMLERVGGRHVREAATGQSRNAPPLAVSTTRRTPAAGWPSRHWKTALCSLSTGSSRAPGARRGHDELAGEHEDFLRGEREILAGGERGERGSQAGGADDGDEHDVGLGQLREFDQPGEPAVDSVPAGNAPGRPRRGEAASSNTPTCGTPNWRAMAASFSQLARAAMPTSSSLSRMRGDHAQGVFADGAGGAEEDDAFAGEVRQGGRCKRRSAPHLQSR